MTDNLTLVTGYWDLGKLESRPSDKNKEMYFKWADFLFKLDINLVFFVSKEDNMTIWRERRKYGHLAKTLIINRDFEELKLFYLRDDFQKMLTKNPYHIREQKIMSANYAVIANSKLFLLEEVMKMNPFDTTHFGWIDFGIYHVASYESIPEKVEDILKPLGKKIRILQLASILEKEIVDIKKFCMSRQYKIAGGLFIGEQNHISELIQEFKKIFFELISQEVCTLEEEIIAVIMQTKRELFNPSYGHYKQIIVNHKKIFSMVSEITDIIDGYSDGGEHQVAFDIASRVFNQNYQNLTAQQKAFIFRHLITNAYHIDSVLCVNQTNIWISYLNQDPELRHESRIIMGNALKVLYKIGERDLANRFIQILSKS